MVDFRFGFVQGKRAGISTGSTTEIVAQPPFFLRWLRFSKPENASHFLLRRIFCAKDFYKKIVKMGILIHNFFKEEKMQNIEAISKIVSILEENDFSAGYIKKITENLNQKYADCENVEFESVKKTVNDFLKNSVEFGIPQNKKKPRIVLTVGAAGSGKTTSLIKMAGKLLIDVPRAKKTKIMLISTDIIKIAAMEKIIRFGVLLNAKVETAELVADVQKIVQENNEKVDVIFIDVSTKNQEKISELFSEDSEIYLTIPATMKRSVIEKEIKKYGAKFAIITKIDETNCYGNVISAIAGTGIKIAYVTNGEMIPRDFKETSIKDFLPTVEF